MRVAWKTGTSYGYRDAWALGSTRRYTVGVWVGRPDGTPLPGQYGALTALPLLFETIDSLPTARGDASARPPPPGVAAVDVCWPLGVPPDPAAPELCRRKRQAWTLDGHVPPTFAERDARAWNAGIERFDVDASTGQRLTGECTRLHVRRAASIARWPALAAPWLSQDARAAAQLPPLSPDCTNDGRDAGESLRIDGLVDRARLARPSNSTAPLRLSVRALGSEAPIRWLVDGRLVGETRGTSSFDLHIAQDGAHTLTALAETGAWSTVDFRVLQ